MASGGRIEYRKTSVKKTGKEAAKSTVDEIFKKLYHEDDKNREI